MIRHNTVLIPACITSYHCAPCLTLSQTWATDMGLMGHETPHGSHRHVAPDRPAAPRAHHSSAETGLGPHTARRGTSVRVPRARTAGACQKPWGLPALWHKGHMPHRACCVASGTRVSLSESEPQHPNMGG